MKTAFSLCVATVLLTLMLPCANADIIDGPITNPDNGHDYYLLGSDTWSNSEVEAESLGGTLAIVKNAAQEDWIYSTFASHGQLNRVLWIGLHRKYPGGPFVWANGQETNSTYQDWCETQPDNGGGIEDSVDIWTPNNGWNDARNGEQNYGVAELPGDSRKSLTENEKSLMGVWYESGKTDRPCYIAATSNRLFAIDNQRAGMITSAKENSFAVPGWNSRGEIVQDHILWSNGTWWSRKPSNNGPTGRLQNFPDIRF